MNWYSPMIFVLTRWISVTEESRGSVSAQLQDNKGGDRIAFVAQTNPETFDAFLFAQLLRGAAHSQQGFAQLVVLQVEIPEQDTLPLSGSQCLDSRLLDGKSLGKETLRCCMFQILRYF